MLSSYEDANKIRGEREHNVKKTNLSLFLMMNQYAKKGFVFKNFVLTA